MLNYCLDRNKSKTFVKFYEKDGDTLRIHYGNKTTHIVPDTKETRDKLNKLMESQINDEETQLYFKKVGEKKCGYDVTSALIPVICGFTEGLIYGANGTTNFIASAIGGTGFLLHHAQSIYNGQIIKDHKKYELYLKFKNEIQEYLTYDEEDNDLNEQQPREVLSINDVHFMSYRQMKQMTNDISYVLDEIETDKKRDEALGLDRERSLFKQRVKELKRNKRS